MSPEFFHSTEVFIERLQSVDWRAQEVVKELNDRPHLLVRVEITGPRFPHRAAEPFVRILSDDRVVAESWFADISEDNLRLLAYFPTDVPQGGIIEFGYGRDVMGRIQAAFESRVIQRLDRERLPKETVEVSTQFLRTKR
jgi:hypothetical protein